MSHLPILPIVVPLVTAVLLLIGHKMAAGPKRAIALISALLLAAIAATMLVAASDGTIRVYHVGAWPAPYGIVLVLDRLAALMVALSAMLTLAVVIAAMRGTDEQGRHFHPLLQLQIAGLNGAFLTGDLFNLFVFFEILLLASYTLLVHGGGLERVRSSLTYVVLNLAGSALFLISLGLTYGTLGTLTMADIGVMLARVPASDQALVRTTMMMVVAVFLLKAAVLPLGFWLPHVYSAATFPVAALFVIMTKVGIYALLRVASIGFTAAPFTAELLNPWLTWIAIGTIATGSVGLLAARRLAVVAANLVLVSSGTLLLGVAAMSVTSVAAMLYYLVSTTVVMASFFLLIDAIASERGPLADKLEKGGPMKGAAVLGGVYLVLAIAASGVPPLSGFLGKLMVMQALWAEGTGPAAWVALLLSSMIAVLVLARAASTIFWEARPADDGPDVQVSPRSTGSSLALILMVLASFGVMLAARPIASYARAAAEQIADRAAYVTSVLGAESEIERERRP